MIINNLRNVGLFLFIALSIFSCRSQKNQSEHESNVSNINVVNEAINSFLNSSDSIQVISNNEGNWELYLAESKQDESIPITNISFFIYDKINNKILYNNNYTRAHIKWYNNKQLLLIRDLGIIDKRSGLSTKTNLIDIESKKILEHTPTKPQF